MSQHGVAAAARFYSRKLGRSVSETTASSLKKAYLQGVKEKKAAEDDGDVRLLPMKKRGRRVQRFSITSGELGKEGELSLHEL